MLVKKSRALQNDEKMKHMWKSWNFRWDSISHHFQYFRIKFQWITDLISAIESSHRAESNTVLEKSRAYQNAEKNWNLLRMHHFRSKFTTFPYEHLEAQAWTDNKTITISSVLSHCMLENCAELIWMIGFREKLKLQKKKAFMSFFEKSSTSSCRGANYSETLSMV